MSKSYCKEEYANNEIETIKDFFNYHSLEESRDSLWKWLNVSGSSGFNELSISEREDLLTFYAHLQGLIEAVHKLKMTLEKDVQ